MSDDENMTTYRRADGDLISGEFAFVTDLDWFDGEAAKENYVEVVAETWSLVERTTLKLGNTDRWCEVCEEDVRLPEPVDGPAYCDVHATEKAGRIQVVADAVDA